MALQGNCNRTPQEFDEKKGTANIKLDVEDNQGDDSCPDGSLQGWLIVVGGWSASFCAFGWLNAAGIFQDYYQAQLFPSMRTSDVAWITATATFVIYVGVSEHLCSGIGNRFALSVWCEPPND